MIKFKINIYDALKRIGYNTYQAKTSGLIGQETLKKIKEENTNITLETLNKICMLLNMKIDNLIEYEDSEKEKNNYSYFNKKEQ